MVSTRGTTSGLLWRATCGRTYKPGSKKGVLLCAGLNGTVDYWAEDVAGPLGGLGLSAALADAGIPAASCATDATWGNSTMRGRLDTLKANAQASLFASGKVHLVGQSMGCSCVLNWAKSNPTLVQSITLILPAVDVQAIEAEDRFGIGLKASIDAAYSGGPPPDAENPADNAATLGAIGPMRLYGTENDAVAKVGEARAFADAAGAEWVSMGTQGGALITGHTIAAPFSPSQLADWITDQD